MISQKDKEVLESLKRLAKKGYISIRVDITPEHAEKGDGKWNVTRSFIKLGDDFIRLDDGNVELVEPI